MNRLRATFLVLALLLLAVVVAALRLGQGDLADVTLRATLLDLRATRIVAAFIAGAALGTGGAVAQGLFRNPLVSPSILGTTAGASLGGQLGLLSFALWPRLRMALPVMPDLLMPLGCLAGAGLALFIVLAFCRSGRGPLLIILTGFILTSLFLSLGGFVTSLAQDSWEVGRAVVAFTLGGLGGVGWRQIALASPLVAVGLGATWLWGGALDLLLSGDEEAATLGLDVDRTRRWIIVWLAVLTAAAVSLGGNVAFVGLIAPHVLRPLVGVQHRRLIPASALLGGTFLVGCDLLARVLPSRSEIPLGVITGLVGAPIFLVLLSRVRKELAHG